MPRNARYSPSRSRATSAAPPEDSPGAAVAGGPDAPDPASPAMAAAAPAPRPVRRERRLWAALGALALLLAGSVAWQWQQPAPHRLTQKEIDAAVMRTLSTTVLPSAVARAAESVMPSVVRVESFGRDKKGKEVERGIGTGVVIVDKGVILTNLHVVAGSDRIQLTFADGSESTAHMTGAQPENDLAVLQAHKVPDDLPAATLRSTQTLRSGEEVVAIGFPFGIGPSVSSGVVSGLGRQFTSPEGKRELSNLIQFDAAANPGNSGGPLITLDGEVVGIVTAILNPTPARTFLGIGFAVPIESAASAAGMPPF